jgi:hypothetical protein
VSPYNDFSNISTKYFPLLVQIVLVAQFRRSFSFLRVQMHLYKLLVFCPICSEEPELESFPLWTNGTRDHMFQRSPPLPSEDLLLYLTLI